jgi:long-chain acyl-CoA synthetase
MNPSPIHDGDLHHAALPLTREGSGGVPLWHRDWVESYPPDVPSSLTYPSIPVSGLLQDTAERRPTHPGCTIFGTEISYGRLFESSRRLASSLMRLGATRGRRVGLLLPNIPEYVMALNAVWMSGATALQLSPLLVPEEIDKLLRATDCHIVVTLDLLSANVMKSLVQGGPLEHVVLATLEKRLAPWKGWLYRVERVRRHGPLRLRDDHHVHSFERLVRVATRFEPPLIVPEEDIALMVPTGGTTGSPKIVMLTHRNLVANALQLKAWSRTREAEEGILSVLPFFHAYGLTVCMLTGTASAATLHLHPRFDARAILDIIRRRRPTLAPAVPAMLAALNRAMKEKPCDLSCIRSVICGASALDPGVRAEFEAAGARYIAEGYGLSEASPVTHANPLSDQNRSGTIGLPLPDTEARIMDQNRDTEEVPIGQVGELVIRGPQVMAGYYNNPAETDRALRNGWLYTGDLARRDRDGFFTIVDRKKDIIKTSGFLVYPAEVEEVLLRFAGIAEAAVIGVPDLEKGEIVKALIVPQNGALDLNALTQYCEQHLGKHKRPRQIEVVKQLPKNFLGKILRRQLRENETMTVKS